MDLRSGKGGKTVPLSSNMPPPSGIPMSSAQWSMICRARGQGRREKGGGKGGDGLSGLTDISGGADMDLNTGLTPVTRSMFETELKDSGLSQVQLDSIWYGIDSGSAKAPIRSYRRGPAPVSSKGGKSSQIGRTPEQTFLSFTSGQYTRIGDTDGYIPDNELLTGTGTGTDTLGTQKCHSHDPGNYSLLRL